MLVRSDLKVMGKLSISLRKLAVALCRSMAFLLPSKLLIFLKIASEDTCDCQKAFAELNNLEGGADRARRLDQARPNCQCEKHSVSHHSSGVVASSEILIRVLVAPQHMAGRSRPRAAALTDAERTGLSVLREGTATDEEIRSVAEGLVARARRSNGDKAGVFGVLKMECGVVRGVAAESDATSAYCVYDTALLELGSHAEIFQRVHDVEAPVHEERRKKLFDVVRPTFVSVADFRNGLLADLAPKT